MKIFISPTAFLKMQALVMGYDKEVGWWGTVERMKEDSFRIKDILVFPQYTGAAYIDDEQDDPLEMSKWLDGLKDEVFNEKRFFGHSHVNMSTYFSGEDRRMFNRQVDTIKRASQNRYYLSVVLNKRGEMCWMAYDGDTDKEYTASEIEIFLEVEPGVTNIDFFKASKEMVKDLRSSKQSMSLIFNGNKQTYTARQVEPVKQIGTSHPGYQAKDNDFDLYECDYWYGDSNDCSGNCERCEEYAELEGLIPYTAGIEWNKDALFVEGFKFVNITEERLLQEECTYVQFGESVYGMVIFTENIPTENKNTLLSKIIEKKVTRVDIRIGDNEESFEEMLALSESQRVLEWNILKAMMIKRCSIKHYVDDEIMEIEIPEEEYCEYE